MQFIIARKTNGRSCDSGRACGWGGVGWVGGGAACSHPRSRAWAGSSARLQGSKPLALPPARRLHLKDSTPSCTAPPAGGQVFKHAQLWGTRSVTLRWNVSGTAVPGSWIGHPWADVMCVLVTLMPWWQDYQEQLKGDSGSVGAFDRGCPHCSTPENSEAETRCQIQPSKACPSWLNYG